MKIDIRKQMIPLSVPNFEGNERKYVDDAIDQGWVSTGGAYIRQLEEGLADYLHVDKVAACQSGTSAIHLALIDAGITKDDMVIVPTLTFIAAVNPVKYQLAHPIFMDCDDSLCMDPIKLAQFCEQECEFKDGQLYYQEHPVKAIIVVHVFGNMADMESIMTTARKYGLLVIEDATEALGTQYKAGRYQGKYAGTIGDYGAYSFNGNKIITTGGGGAVTASDPARVDHMRYLSTQAKDDEQYYIHHEVGYNYRMTNVQAAIGVAQLEELPEFIRRKKDNYRIYQDLLGDFEQGTILPVRNDIESNHWFYALELHVEQPDCSIADIIQNLKDYNIQTRAIWGLIHEQIPYSGNKTYNIEKALYYRDHIINLPCSTQITKEDIQYVASVIKYCVRRI